MSEYRTAVEANISEKVFENVAYARSWNRASLITYILAKCYSEPNFTCMLSERVHFHFHFFYDGRLCRRQQSDKTWIVSAC